MSMVICRAYEVTYATVPDDHAEGCANRAEETALCDCPVLLAHPEYLVAEVFDRGGYRIHIVGGPK